MLKQGFLKNVRLKEVLDKTVDMLMAWVAKHQPSKKKRKRAEYNKRYYDKTFGKYSKRRNKWN